ncbi:uncharacterized protein LOC144143391 [Haemaphysalis longicornis]
MFLSCTSPGRLDFDASAMWRLDAIGIDNPTHEKSLQDSSMETFERNITRIEGRYQVPLMIQAPGLPPGSDNRQLAEHRLRTQRNRFREQPELLEQYDRAIRAYFDENHAEQVAEQQRPGDNLYYMPHHAVIRKDVVTTKLRVVFDASSHTAGQPCLNDVLCKGMKLGVEVVQLLMTFCCHPVVIVADIKKAYLQLLIRPEDRDALRFLWVERLPTRDNPASPIVTWRMTRVPFGASSSPFLLAATIRHHLQACREQYPETVALLERAFYVDDLIIGVPSVEKAIQVYEEARKIFSEAGMEIRKWASNSEELGHQFVRDNVAIENEAGDAIRMKVLGVPWERAGDCIYLSTKDASEFAAANPSAKRTVLQTFARMYDPLGYFAPFTVTAKLVFQDLWKKSRSWDERLPDDEQARWNSWQACALHAPRVSGDRDVVNPS